MMTAVLAFSLQGMLIAASDGASHLHHGQNHFQHEHADAEHSHVLTHVHVDGTMHRHAIDDDEGLAEHTKGQGCPCCSAVVVGTLPSLNICPVGARVAYKLVFDTPAALIATDPGRLTRPPSTPSIG